MMKYHAGASEWADQDRTRARVKDRTTMARTAPNGPALRKSGREAFRFSRGPLHQWPSALFACVAASLSASAGFALAR